jgi:protein-disulfide isomerase
MARMLNQEVLPAERKTTRLVFRHFPLGMHNWALAAAQTTACAQEQGDDYFWRLHDLSSTISRSSHPTTSFKS